MKKIYLPLIALIGMTSPVFAQEKSNKEAQADKYYTSYSFDKAIESYNDVKHLSAEGQRRLAESYHHNDQDTLAEEAYKKLLAYPSGTVAEDYFNSAMVFKANGKYEDANRSMDKFLQLKPNDLRAKSYLLLRSGFAGLLKDEGRYKVEHLSINTKAEDFGTSFYMNKIVFASSRENPKKMVKRRSNWNRMPYLDMYVSEVEGGQMKAPEGFDNALNGKWNEGPASFSKDGNFMAFTRNNTNLKRADRIVKLEIFFMKKTDGKWSDPIPYALNKLEYSVGQPALSADGKTMFFASDMPGGFGGVDIYRTKQSGDGTWSKPENLGNKINTEGDEMFPFQEGEKGMFFFASNGHYGLGGLDVFVCMAQGEEFGPVFNAGTPVNTRFDDFAVIVDPTTNKGYLSSNRTGGNGSDDIYSFEVLKGFNIGKQIEGVAHDNRGKTIKRVFITLMDENGAVLDTVTTRDGSYSFLADADKNFKLEGKKENYSNGNATASTFGKELIVKAELTLTEDLKSPKVGDNLASFLNPIYFDYNKYEIRADAKKELDHIADIMNTYPAMEVELGSHTDCRASEKYNQELSDKRAQASVEYIRKMISKPGRISGKGYGKTRLLNTCPCEAKDNSGCSPQEQAKNRRTEFIIVKK